MVLLPKGPSLPSIATLTDHSTLTPAKTSQVVEDAIAAADQLLSEATDRIADRTYANTLAPLDQALNPVRDADGISGLMARIHPDEPV